MEFNNRTFLVTGGASGLGEATVIALLERGANVVVADLKGKAPDGARFVETDVADEDQVAAAVAMAAEDGTFAGAVNCAGIAPAEKVLGKDGPHSQSVFLKTLSVNLAGTFNVIRLAAQALQNNEPGPSGERGVIINTTSVAAFEGQIGQAAYSASKGGVVGMTLPIARELARYGIRVVTIAPGLFLTPLAASAPPEMLDAIGKTVPFPQRLGHPSEYAALACHIVENQMLNGETIRLDGAIRLTPK